MLNFLKILLEKVKYKNCAYFLEKYNIKYKINPNFKF